MDAYDVIIMPWLTEKSMEARSMEQRLEFIVDKRATRRRSLAPLRPSLRSRSRKSTRESPSTASTPRCAWPKDTTRKTPQCAWVRSDLGG
ncbi:MAG: hypothetical protein CM15mP79_1840 [Methanobacteriota archaeon]|nr:MAG: hypothetical protein CM15mP79_1840 [Euryarchaeota archaeon]